tara:strand:- start:153 stop:548 length:396 start_codon:yes stop_codon:yes gene_type:complete
MLSLSGESMKRQQRKLKSKLSKFIKFDFDSVELTHREKSEVVMDVLTEFKEFLVDIKFDSESIYPPMLYAIIAMFLESTDDLEEGRQVVEIYLKRLLDREFNMRKRVDDSCDPEKMDFFNTFVDGDSTTFH